MARRSRSPRLSGDQVLSEVLDHFSTGGLAAEGDSWGPSAIVDSWLEPGSEVIRIVYRRWETDAPVIGYRCDVALQRDGHLIPSKEIASDVIDQISEPLGRQADLLVEEQGVWWWGDGYPDVGDSPYPLHTREELVAQIEAEFGPIDDFVIEATNPED